MMFVFLDKTLVCRDCGREFIWSAGEQEFYAVMGFGNDPKRCPQCRKLRRYGNRRPLTQHKIICDACGKEASVPFTPREGRPVYCRQCFEERQASDVA